MKNLKKNYNCIFTGGSSRGLCYIGVLKAIEELDINITSYTGSSIGALMAVFHALGYNAGEMEKEADSLNLCSLFRDFNINILRDFAFSNGNIYLNWIREKIEKKYYGSTYKKGEMPPVCFKDIEKNIIVAAADLLSSNIVIFSKETTPDFETAQAIRASSSMPALLKPFKYQNRILIDGDILRGRPIWKAVPFLIKDENKILEFRITGGNNNQFAKNPVKIINSVINAAAYTIDNDAAVSYKNSEKIDIIQIDVPNVNFTDFKFSIEKKKEIYNIGYETTKKFLSGLL